MNSAKSNSNKLNSFSINEEFSKYANIKTESEYQAMIKQANDDYEAYWGKLAKQHLDWYKSFTQILDTANPPFYRWFYDGELNISYNCLDRHLEKKGDKTAIIFESDNGSTDKISYKELHSLVCRLSNGLKKLGVKVKDRVIIYLPNSIEAIAAMQACARIGAIHSVVFSGFGDHLVYDRINDAQAKVVITADTQIVGGVTTHLKNEIDKALTNFGNTSVEKVVVLKKSNSHLELNSKRDIWWHDLIDKQSDICEPTVVNAEQPLFILYTSGSTGKPKGVVHSSGGFLLGAMVTLDWVFDLKDNDIYWAAANVGGISGHTYLAYGLLASGATQVIFEGVPTYPTPARFWQIIEKHRVSIFYTAPNELRSLNKLGAELPNNHDLSSLRLLGCVGEPINSKIWMWYYDTVGRKKCPIVDTWWQTEVGSICIAPLPGVTPLMPGSCTRVIPGIIADVIDKYGKTVTDQKGGYLVIKKPFPSLLRTTWGDDERFKDTYFPSDIADGRYYVTGDYAYRNINNYYRVSGRMEDTINAYDKRLGSIEIESALTTHPNVAEVAIVGKTNDIKNESLIAFVVTKNFYDKNEENIIKELNAIADKESGITGFLDSIKIISSLPKTHSGKIVRRLLRQTIQCHKINQDISTLEDPSIVEKLNQISKKNRE